MTSPSPTISKKKGKQVAKTGQGKEANKATTSSVADVEISPVSIKSSDSSGAHVQDSVKKMIPGAQDARRTLNFSNINLSALATFSSQISSIGSIKRTPKSVLDTKTVCALDVKIHVSPVRLPETWDKFKFFAFVDHTGILSIGAPVEIFSCLEQFPGASPNVIPQITIEGKMHVKWSTKAKGELYITIRNNGASVTATTGAQHPETFSTFHTIRNIISNTYYSSVTFSCAIGDCVMTQCNDDKQISFMLQDSTGFAVIHVQNAVELLKSTLYGNGPKKFEGKFKFDNIMVDDVSAISATVEEKDVVVRHAYPFIERHINVVKNTKL